MPTCYIFGAGDYGEMPCPAPDWDGFVIAADGGCAKLAQWGIRPQLAVGDFDSLGRVPADVPVQQFPAEKDDSDMMLAVRAGLAHGCTRFLLYGGMGGRLDHTIANLHILDALARQGCAAFLLGADTVLTAVNCGVLRFSARHTGILSLFAWGGTATGVTLRGLRYPLTDGTLCCDRPIGLSNEFLGQEAAVCVQNGTLLALWTPPTDDPAALCPTHFFARETVADDREREG